MGKVMKQIPFDRLMDWALSEYEQSGSVFGVDKFYKNTGGKYLEIFGQKLELPFGPAAGPHTQLAQNIIAGYVAGARFFELKTVQTLDGEDLPVSKPCIAADDECYNVEWSTELYIPEAMDEYIKGWYALKLLSRELGLGDCDGFIFNMSVGYDLDGIKSKKIDDFIEGLRNAENTKSWQACKQWALMNMSRMKNVDRAYIDGISAEVCRSITLSTLHGCPPEEIERIATYLLSEKKLHSSVKCNPTLLGYEYARKTLDDLGFDYITFDDHHFKADLQFCDAVTMFRRLQKLADSLSLSFGVKLTNTFPVEITDGKLPGGEMYMSGRALFPLTVEVVNRLAKEFGGKLRVSYSGGADARNIGKLADAGIWPVTIATTMLKPGGYMRLHQIAGILSGCEYKPFSGVDCDKVQTLVDEAAADPMYRKPAGIIPARKMKAEVPLLDCYAAPCRDGCPISQDVPAYLRLTGEGKHLEALRVITERNPLPFITGSICSQFCAEKCTREFYESAVCIRDVKLEAATQAYEALLQEIKDGTVAGSIPKTSDILKTGDIPGTGDIPKTGDLPETGDILKTGDLPETGGAPNKGYTTKTVGKIAVIGGGPAGLSAAYFLARAGRTVTIFEKRESLGGIVRHIIPAFRISDSDIDNDIGLVNAPGVDIRLNTEVRSLKELRGEGFEQIIIATGAWEPGAFDTLDPTGAEGPDSGVVLDALEFLGRLKQGLKTGEEQIQGIPPHCENIAVIGGGNTAMDVARAAMRMSGVKHVSLVYRRTKRYMPADAIELELALEDGVEFRELLAPVSLKNGLLTCEKMELGAPDASGRRRPIATGETIDIRANAVIYAVGNQIDAGLFAELGIPTDKKGRVAVADGASETSLPGVYVIGDAKRGPATVVQAIADAMHCAKSITGAETEKYEGLNVNRDTETANNKKGTLDLNARAGGNCRQAENQCDARRCLECATICQNCVDVCPNRANIAVIADGRPQIIHIDFMCNECGNCETFCPYSSAPYKDKFTLFTDIKDFEKSKNPGFLILTDKTVRVRIDGKTTDQTSEKQQEGIWPLINAVMDISYVTKN